MTRDKIQQLAREADPEYGNADGLLAESMCGIESIERFAALVLEEAARVCNEAYSRSAGAAERTKSSREITIYQTAASRSEYLAQAIRAMKPEVK
jgi:hypothetical protein